MNSDTMIDICCMIAGTFVMCFFAHKMWKETFRTP
jgi:ethanolamine transporter EutH